MLLLLLLLPRCIAVAVAVVVDRASVVKHTSRALVGHEVLAALGEVGGRPCRRIITLLLAAGVPDAPHMKEGELSNKHAASARDEHKASSAMAETNSAAPPAPRRDRANSSPAAEIVDSQQRRLPSIAKIGEATQHSTIGARPRRTPDERREQNRLTVQRFYYRKKVRLVLLCTLKQQTSRGADADCVVGSIDSG